MKKVITGVVFISAILASFWFGMSHSKNQISKSADRMQAELSFGHLQEYKNLQSDFLSGCNSRVKSRLEFMINEQKMLIAEHVQNVSDQKFEDYINKRDNKLIQELQSYEVNWDKSWTLPNCTN